MLRAFCTDEQTVGAAAGPGGRGGFPADGDGVSSDAMILPECMFSVLLGIHPGVKNRRVLERGCRLEPESMEECIGPLSLVLCYGHHGCTSLGSHIGPSVAGGLRAKPSQGWPQPRPGKFPCSP